MIDRYSTNVKAAAYLAAEDSWGDDRPRGAELEADERELRQIYERWYESNRRRA